MPLPHLLSSRHVCGEQKESDIPIEEARRRIFLFDSKGLVVADRKAGGLNSQKMRYAHKHGACTAVERLLRLSWLRIRIGAHTSVANALL
jgi:hypothetical protein